MIDVETILKCNEFQSFDKNFELIKSLSSIIDQSDARKIIIHILDIWNNVNPQSKEMWIDLIGRAGFYPYFMDKVRDNKDYTPSFQTKIKTEYFKSEYLDNIYFHEKQKEIEQALSSGDNVAVSAPTSFGKSLLIEEIVARKEYQNILIIQPTLALIDETRKKLAKYNDFYNLVVNTRQKVHANNIFILTAERVLEFPTLPTINFFIIDEFYKISSRLNDSRIDALNIVLLKIMNHKPQALFLTPSVDSLSTSFMEKYNVKFFKTDYALVNTNIIEIRTRSNTLLSGEAKKKKLFTLLLEQTEPSIVYVKSPNEAYKLAKEYMDYLDDLDKAITNDYLDVFEWIDMNISPDWQLKTFLQYGIGSHNGALPRHIINTEIDLFNEGKLQVLFATVSLIEGVNTVAKNMIIYNHHKGSNFIDFFDFANIRGRAGRMNRHFTGNVYLFIDQIEDEQFTIDIPSIDQNPVSDEILFNIPDKDVINIERKKVLETGLNEEIQEIIKKNLICINGQKELYKYIKAKKLELEYIKWTTVPTYDELWKTLYLGYKFLKLNDNDGYVKNKSITALNLVNQPLKKLIADQSAYYKKENKKDPLNKAIDYILKFQRTEASFEIPKILSVIDSIQKYIFQNSGIRFGDYSLFSSLLECEQVEERLQFLIDYGIPSSAVKKLNIPTSINEDFKIIEYIKAHDHDICNKLINYEVKLLKDAIR